MLDAMQSSRRRWALFAQHQHQGRTALQGLAWRICHCGRAELR